MENVVAFNNELSGLYDTKPPISKAKMAAITKAAMRAIKFYKHVVQSVEKFILKCKPEYKVPGLYVIDSIVRQSRHQYGPEKDVFAPRFARNIKETFANLFRCAPEDKSRIIRVLNLWQKNNVFAPEVIQPIFDLADPNHPIYQLPPGGIQGVTPTPTDMSNTSNGMMNSGITSLDNSMNASSSNINMSMGEDKTGSALPDLSCLSHDKSKTMEHMEKCNKRQCKNVTTGITTNVCISKIRDQMHSCRSSHCCSCNEVTGCTDANCLLEKKKHFEPCCSNYSKSPHDYCCRPPPQTHVHDELADNRTHPIEDKDESIRNNNECFIVSEGISNNKKKINMDNKEPSPPSTSSNILDVN